MEKTVISTEQIRENILKLLNDVDMQMTDEEVETACDTYIRYYVLRIDPNAFKMVCAEIMRK